MEEIRVAEGYKDDFWSVVRKDYCVGGSISETRNFEVRHIGSSNVAVVSVGQAVSNPNLDKDFKWRCVDCDENTLIIICEDFLTRNTRYVVLWTDGFGIRSYVTSVADVNNPDKIVLVGDLVRFMKQFNGEVYELCKGTGEMVHVGWSWMKKYKDLKEAGIKQVV